MIVDTEIPRKSSFGFLSKRSSDDPAVTPKVYCLSKDGWVIDDAKSRESTTWAILMKMMPSMMKYVETFDSQYLDILANIAIKDQKLRLKIAQKITFN